MTQQSAQPQVKTFYQLVELIVDRQAQVLLAMHYGPPSPLVAKGTLTAGYFRPMDLGSGKSTVLSQLEKRALVEKHEKYVPGWSGSISYRLTDLGAQAAEALWQATEWNPESRSWKSWAGRLAALKSRNVTDTDARVRECRSAMAYYRILKTITEEVAQLSPLGSIALINRMLDQTSLGARTARTPPRAHHVSER